MHRGLIPHARRLPAFALALLFLGAGTAAWSRQAGTPKALVERAIAAHGGRAAVGESDEGEIQEGTVEIYSPIRNSAHITAWHKGDRTLAKMQIGGLEAKVYVDKLGGWKQVLGT